MRFVGFILLVILFSAVSFIQQNNVPVVAIIAPVNNSKVSAVDPIAYTIDVNDKEDGSTKYEEINAAEVFLKVKYLNAGEATAFIQKDQQQEKTFSLMKQNACFTCHSVQQKLAGPSFREIAAKYNATAITYENLSKKIINGSAGVWSDGAQMPAQPHINKEDAMSLAKLLIAFGKEKDFDIYPGTEGFIKPAVTTAQKSNSSLLLIASYLDHGINDADRKNGSAVSSISFK